MTTRLLLQQLELDFFSKFFPFNLRWRPVSIAIVYGWAYGAWIYTLQMCSNANIPVRLTSEDSLHGHEKLTVDSSANKNKYDDDWLIIIWI